jgi:hypothetical protein
MVVTSLHSHLLGEIKVEIQTSLNGLTSLVCAQHMNREVGAPRRQLTFPERTPAMLFWFIANPSVYSPAGRYTSLSLVQWQRSLGGAT